MSKQEECALAKKGSGLKVFESAICLKQMHTVMGLCDVESIVMENFDMTLNDYIQHCSTLSVPLFLNELPKCKKIIKILRKIGQNGANLVIHGDLHLNNILLKKLPNGLYDAKVIDFGFSSPTKNQFSFIIEIEIAIVTMKLHLLDIIANLDFPNVPLENWQLIENM